jgi:hypothetical protein
MTTRVALRCTYTSSKEEGQEPTAASKHRKLAMSLARARFIPM